MAALIARNLTKYFEREGGRSADSSVERRITAVDHINFEIGTGELFGLLGPNGAGKTTTIKMLSTLLLPDDGDAVVGGFSALREANRVRPLIGVITGGERGLYYRLTARENLLFFARLYNIPDDRSKKVIEDLLKLVGLLDRADDRVEQYSKGMKQRLHIARGLVHDPSILLMDEPTIGLDPNSAFTIREFIKEELQKNLGKTILLTTHYMFEADKLCDRVAIIDYGKIISLGSPGELKARVSDRNSAELVVRNFSAVVESRVRALPDVRIVSTADAGGDTKLRLEVGGNEEALAEILDAIVKGGGKVLSFTQASPSLEDVFISVTGREARD